MAAQEVVFVTGGSGFVGRSMIPFLINKGYQVKALARSAASKKIVEDLGAESVDGDLENEEGLRKGCQGANHVVHLAAKVDLEGALEDFRRITVQGALKTLQLAQAEKVKSFVLVSSEQAILGGPTIDKADETWPYPSSPLGPYAQTKGEAERACFEQAEKGEGEEKTRVMVVRPRLIWGLGDSTVLPAMCKAVETGDWKWIGGGEHLTSTVHVQNCCAGILAAMERGKSGEIYFVTDGEPVQFKSFMTRLIATRGVDASKSGSLPYAIGKIAGWFGIIPAPVVRLFGETCTVVDEKARKELGYENVISIEEGIKEMEEDFAASKKADESG